MNEPSDREEPQLRTTFSYEVLPFEMIEKTYLSLYYMCKAELDLEIVREEANICKKTISRKRY